MVFIDMPKFLGWVFCLALIITILLFGIDLFKQDYISFEKNCDKKLGNQNWEVIETTGEGSCKGFMGQCFNCVSKEDFNNG